MTTPVHTSPLRERAQLEFQHRDVRGFSTFAPRTSGLVELAGEVPGLLVAVNAEKLAHGNRRLQAVGNTNLAYPDGMGAVLALRRLGVQAERIAGADLWQRIVDRYAGAKRIYLLGARRPVIEAVAAALRARYPAIALGFRDGYLNPGDVEELIREFQATKPELVFVGMGSPRQELLMSRLYEAHPALYMGVGGSFDVFVGQKPRAPRWMQRIGMEWAYQFVREPRRLHRLPAYLKFGVLLAFGRIR